MSLKKIVEDFSKQRIAVVGDLILDQYIRGEVKRISPEAPVQVVDVDHEEFVPGGAANVANNLRALGADVEVLGVIGKDSTGVRLIETLEGNGISTVGVIVDEERQTTVKVRVLGGRQQIVRFDYEVTRDITDKLVTKILNRIKENIDSLNAILVSDYAKGVVTPALMSELTALCHKTKTKLLVDPKPPHTSMYKQVDILTPNLQEACLMAGVQDVELTDSFVASIGKKLVSDLNANILITRGSQGMTLMELSEHVTHIPAHATEVYDIVGAGDTVVATLALALASGAPYKEASQLSNVSAGIVVKKVGTATVEVEELLKNLFHEESDIS